MRETRIVLLALCFFSLAIIFSVHGLTSPGYIHGLASHSNGHQDTGSEQSGDIYEYGAPAEDTLQPVSAGGGPSAALERSPWLAILVGSGFAALSVLTIPKGIRFNKLKGPQTALLLSGTLILGYFGASLAFPNWLAGFPTRDEWFQHLLTGVVLAFLILAAWRYFQSYLFARLSGQLAIVVGLLFLAEAQLSLDLGNPHHLSWWMYHFLFLLSFTSVLVGWVLEIRRAKDVRAIAEALVMRDAIAQLNRGKTTTLVELADRVEAHDIGTLHHVDRVAAYAYLIGKELGMGPTRLRELALAAQMHDLGKISLPAYILRKADKLTDEEFALIRQHPMNGWEIASRTPVLAKMAKVIRQHHERYDGSGYPDGLAGEQITLEARVVSTADTFDAMTSVRPYRPALSFEAAKLELDRVAGSQLDPQCVKALLKALEEEASTGSSALADIQELVATYQNCWRQTG